MLTLNLLNCHNGIDPTRPKLILIVIPRSSNLASLGSQAPPALRPFRPVGTLSAVWGAFCGV
ncbi:hypothetical protein CO2235_10264 [Cupriavidus oxalaticus]|uniref:Uncharacterized protein n=1 Tax=Cupriavidus oxalaticus TaxID=96344 RepID=A0A375FZB1_9BURK|nr:hypothetical protein CO2235_10264 [Cupriavidus oxalaticus]